MTKYKTVLAKCKKIIWFFAQWAYISAKINNLLRLILFITGLILHLCTLAQPPQGQKPVTLPNGEAWLVDERWFERQPPFMEFYKYGEAQGLKLEQAARLCLQDKRGFIWLYDDNANALIRFDGHAFTYFKSDPSNVFALRNARIHNVVETPDGTIWIGQEEGFSSYDAVTGHFRNYVETPDSATAIPDAFWRGRAKPSEGFFDVPTERFVAAFDTRLTDAMHPEQSQNIRFHWILQKGWQDAQGNIWTIGDTPIGNGLLRISDSGQTTTLYPMLRHFVRDKASNPDYDPWLADFCPDTEGQNIWVGGWRGGLRKFSIEHKTWVQFTQNYTRTDSTVGVDLETTLFVRPAPNGCFWLGCTHGLTHFNPKTWRFSAWWHNMPGSIEPENHDLTDVLTDREGRLWVAMGALMVHDPKRHFFQKSLPMPRGRYKGVWHDADRQQTWMLKEASKIKSDGGIVLKNEADGSIKTWFFQEFWNYDLDSHVPLRGLALRGDEVFISTENSLYKMRIASGKLTKIPSVVPPKFKERFPKGPSFRRMALAPDGSLWIALCNNKSGIPLLHYFPDQNRWEYVDAAENGLHILVANAVLIDRQGRIWIGGDHTDRKGVNCYVPGTGQTLRFERETNSLNALPSNLVNNFAEDPLGRIWMTTELGICYFDPKENQIHQVPGFRGNCRHLAIDTKNRVWFGGDEPGFYDPSSGKFRNFTGENGMYDPEQPLYARRDGSIGWGIIYSLNADSIPILSTGPVVHLTGFRVFEREYPLPQHIQFTEKIILPHDANFFSLSWSAINYTNPEADQYACQLTGVDTGWVYCDIRNNISYTKVAPGHYLFRLKAVNRDGVWGPEKTVQISITPAWYQTLGFKGLLISLAFAIFYLFYRVRLKQVYLNAALQQKEAEIKQKETEFQKKLINAQLSALQAQMNPHFVFNSLNSINRFIQLNEPDTASNYLTKFSRLIRLILDNSREGIISLQQELEACRLYLELETLRFAGQFRYQIEIIPPVDATQIQIPPMLIQPYLENAVWHGLMQKDDDDRQLLLSVRELETGIKIVIEDNGIGREKARILKSKSVNRQKSHGMHLTQERIELYQISTGVNISAHIDDLKGKKGEVVGTKVEIFIKKTI
jgi:ligand-binding sensor domain-containing protein